jgi:hypothetical protein
MIFDTVVWFFFRLIDLAVIGGLVWYLMVKQIIPAIKARMQHDAYAREQLEQQKQARYEQEAAHANALAEQEMHTEVLKQKLALWADAIAAQEQEWDLQRKHLQELQRERVQLQQQALERQQLVKDVIPRVFLQARNELIQKFSDHADAQAYLEQTLNNLRERS